jgi:ABC-type uncharacterized transport system substrate-binding protein
LSPITASIENHRVAAFVQRLRELAWIEGRTAAVKVRWAEGRSLREADLVVEFVREKVDVIVSMGTASVLAAKQATSVVPIVFAVGDPVGTGLVVSLAPPGGNVTGLSLHPDRSCWQTTRTSTGSCPSPSSVSDFGQCRPSCHPA